MNNKNLDRVLNTPDSNFEIPKTGHSNQNTSYVVNRIQNSHDSQFAAETINVMQQRLPQTETQNKNFIDEKSNEPIKSIINDSPVGRNVRLEVTKNITDYIPYDLKDEGVRVLSDGKVFNKKFSVKILGVGGAGNNIVKYLARSQWPDFVTITALNTDFNALNRMPNVKERYVIGHEKLNGNGAGGDPKIAREAAESDSEQIKKAIDGADILLLIAGLGKGTGTGAAPVIAKIANEMNILTVGLFNLPSIGAEGKKIYSNALEGLENLQKYCNGFTAIANDRVIGIDRERTSIKRAYDDANEYFKIIVSEFIDMITIGADVNVDFSDIKNFFGEKNGFIFIKVNVSDYSKDSIKKSIEEAIKNGYIEIDIRESSSALYNLKINENVPSIILENAREALKEIVKSDDLNVVQGMSFSDTHENAEINILISGKFDTGKLAEEIYKTIDEPIKTKQIIIPEEVSIPPPTFPDPTIIIPEATKYLDDNFSYIARETSRISNVDAKTNIIRTEEIMGDSYLRSQPKNSGVGTKISLWKRFLSFFDKK